MIPRLLSLFGIVQQRILDWLAVPETTGAQGKVSDTSDVTCLTARARTCGEPRAFSLEQSRQALQRYRAQQVPRYRPSQREQHAASLALHTGDTVYLPPTPAQVALGDDWTGRLH